MDYNDLLNLARDASKNSYSPYSKFAVGACVLSDSGKTYQGCNFENSSFGMTICAERNAIGTMITAGDRKIRAVAIYSPNIKNCTPCGACRQVISEFKSDCGVDIVVEADEGIKIYKIEELLPETFGI